MAYLISKNTVTTVIPEFVDSLANNITFRVTALFPILSVYRGVVCMKVEHSKRRRQMAELQLRDLLLTTPGCPNFLF